MSETRVRIDPDDPQSLPPGRVDHAVLDGTTEEGIALQARHDDADAMPVRQPGPQTATTQEPPATA